MKKIWGFAFASLMAAGAAHALQLPSTSNYTDTTTAGTDIGNWSETVALQQFNPVLGSLSAVTFTLSGGLLAEFYATSAQASPQTVTNTLLGQLRFAVPSLKVQSLGFSESGSYALDGFADELRTLEDSDSISFTLLGDWDSFVGTSVFNVDVEASSQSAGQGGGNIDELTVPTFGATVSVRYDYTANHVPEPGSLALVALALAASRLAAQRRHR